MRKNRKVDEKKFDFIEEYAKAVEEAESRPEEAEEAPEEQEAEESGASTEEQAEASDEEAAPEEQTEASEEIPKEQEETSEESGADEEEEEETLEIDTDSPEYRRMMRHKRRVRNQILAYTGVLILFALIAAGLTYGLHSVAVMVNEQREAEAAAEALAAAEAAAQEEIVIEAPEVTATPETDTVDDTYTEDAPVMSEEDYLAEMVASTISQMPVEDKIAQLFMVTPEALTGVSAATKAGDGTRDALSKYAVCGLIYDRRNIESEDQLTELIDNTRNMSKYDLFLGVREAGGENCVLSGSKLGDIPSVDSPADIVASGESSNAYNTGVTMSSYLSYFGFNMNLAPNGSLTADEASVSAGMSYGSDEALACEMITQMIGGLKTGNINACMTDFPGTGNITESTADGRVDSEITAEEVTAQTVPYITGIASGATMIQTNNVTYLNADVSSMPASLSEYVINSLIRGEMAYDGIVVTAPLNEKAITEYYTPEEAAIYALAAGADILYMPEDFEAAYNGLLAAAADGTLPESRIDASLERIFRVKLAGYVE